LRQIDGRWIPVLNKIGVEEMFLKRDLFDHASSSATRGTQANLRSLYLIIDIRYKQQV
jgi:hypothetical protein